MAKFVRYSLAAVCFAASVGCLALWWRSYLHREQFGGAISQSYTLGCTSFLGYGSVWQFEIESPKQIPWLFRSETIDPSFRPPAPSSAFRFDGNAIYFPLWYPALIVALAGVVALRFRRQFSLRSALVATTAIAALIAMAVIL